MDTSIKLNLVEASPLGKRSTIQQSEGCSNLQMYPQMFYKPKPPLCLEMFLTRNKRVRHTKHAVSLLKFIPYTPYLITAPFGTAFGKLINVNTSSFSADKIIPSDFCPINFAGFKFVTTATFLPIISSGA